MSDAVEQLDPAAAVERVQHGGAFLLDVREPEEWAAGHAPDAHHLPLSQFNERHAEVLPTPSTPIVAVCRSGARSQRAAEALRAAGYDVANLAGGMQAWAADGHEVVTDDGTPGQVA
jgi:rhodanese-related sulfurtransferase